MPVSVDIVLPCYNPTDKWHLELLDFHSFIKDHYNAHYIVVNDGSLSSNINTQIDHLQKENISVDFIAYSKNHGKGFALRRGVTVAMSDYVMYTDIDFPFTNKSALDVLHCLVNTNADVVAGYRDESYYTNKMSGFRRLLSRTFRFFIKKGLHMPVSDTQCGLKAFNKKGRQKFLSTQINRYLFDFEFIYTSCNDKAINLATIPVELKPDIVFSTMRPAILAQESFNLLRILLFRKR